MENSTGYNPIQCAVHDGYELACMRKEIHQVSWKTIPESSVEQSDKLRFLDLHYDKEGEFLIAKNQSGECFRIRLDLITSKLPY